jgi:hypothetical protein
MGLASPPRPAKPAEPPLHKKEKPPQARTARGRETAKRCVFAALQGRSCPSIGPLTIALSQLAHGGTIVIAFERPIGPRSRLVPYPMYSYWVWPTEGRTQCGMESRMGRIDEMWMTCRASLTAAVLDVRRMGMRCGRAPPGTRLRVRAILSMRLSLTHITISDRPLLLSLPFLALSRSCS